MATKPLKPGQTAPVSAQYEIIGARGARTNVERTVPKGTKLPPTPKAGQSYIPVDRTRNKSGRG